MRLIILKVFLLVILILTDLQTRAQVCTGSLGDPVINETFGDGTNPGPFLPPSVTTLFYTKANCPDDGYYTIANSLVSLENCHPFTWHDVANDHTGDPDGYMMIINASQLPSIFFTQQAKGLCQNTTYEFSAYILNLITLAASGPDVSEPNILFSIEEASTGKVLASYTTGTILPTDNPTWNKYGIYFKTTSLSDVIVKMSNLAPGGNGNDFILDDITFRACGPIIQTGFGSPAGTVSEDLCEGTSADFTLKATVTGNNNPVYQWQSNLGNGWSDIPGKTSNLLDVALKNPAKGIYQYRLGVANGTDISSVSCRVYSAPLSVNVTPYPVVAAITPQTFCEGNKLVLTATGGGVYSWTGPNLPPTSQNPLVINNVTSANAGIYTVAVTSDKGCSAVPVQVPVMILPKVVASVSNNVTICAGSQAQINASGGIFYKWTPATGLDHDDIANPKAAPLQTTTYQVDVSNGGCNDDTKGITVTVKQNPFANAGDNKQIHEGQSVKLSGSLGGDDITGFFWTPSTNLDDPASLTPVANPTDNITYTLNVQSKSCGQATSSVHVRVYKKIIIPNTFTPNNDGINDYWNIVGLITYPESSIMIFNRYGQKVYHNIGYSVPWNGTINGSPMPEGTYYYIIDLKNDTPKLTGWVLIVR